MTQSRWLYMLLFPLVLNDWNKIQVIMIHKFGFSREKGYPQTDRQTDRQTNSTFIYIDSLHTFERDRDSNSCRDNAAYQPPSLTWSPPKLRRTEFVHLRCRLRQPRPDVEPSPCFSPASASMTSINQFDAIPTHYQHDNETLIYQDDCCGCWLLED